MTMTDIESGLTAFFEQDHRDCDARWVDVEELLDADDIDSARPAWQKFQRGLRRHIAMEEEVLFPAFEAVSDMDSGGPTAVMRVEHQQMLGFLEQIEAAIQAGKVEQAIDTGDMLLMLIQQHCAKEEGVLYPMAENLLAGQWAELSARLENY